MSRPIIGLTMGDPAGVGPELCLQAATNPKLLEVCRPVIYGNSTILSRVKKELGFKVTLNAMPEMRALSADHYDFTKLQPKEDNVYSFSGTRVSGSDGELGSQEVADAIRPAEFSAVTGEMSFNFVTGAIDDAMAGHISAIVTAPIQKEAWHAAGIDYPGHTELLAEQTKTGDYCMMMTSPKLSCSLVTCHIAVHDVPTQITPQRIEQVTRLTHTALTARLGRAPRIAVLGLNPHAGENGLFGKEESQLIEPAIAALRESGIEVEGPLPPDTAFLPTKLDSYDAHICMYHDQGLIPFKALAFDTGVNVTLGLPIIRTSVDHGTALDIAWQGKADPSSMFAATEMAAAMAKTIDPS